MRDPKEIDLPFGPESIPLVLSGTKTCTTRRSRKGRRGDTFEVMGREYRITKVERVSLFRAYSNWEAEGFGSTREMVDAIRRTCPSMDITAQVYVHHFKAVLA